MHRHAALDRPRAGAVPIRGVALVGLVAASTLDLSVFLVLRTPPPTRSR